MKTIKTFGFLAAALTALAGWFPQQVEAAGALGDIRSITRAEGGSMDKVNAWPNVNEQFGVGDVVKFRIRVINYECTTNANKQLEGQTPAAYVNTWVLKQQSGDDPWSVTNKMPRIGLWTSSGLRMAEVTHTVPSDDAHYTDLICSYTVQDGDFAQPLRLADGSGLKAADPTDTAALSTGLYYIENNNFWWYEAKDPDDVSKRVKMNLFWGPTYTSADSKKYFYWIDTKGKNDVPSSQDSDGKKNYDLSLSGIYIKTFDFDTSYADGDTWRKIPAGETDLTGTIVFPTPTTQAFKLYVWTEKTTVAAVENNKGTITEVIERTDPVTGKKYMVATVPVPAGVTSVQVPIKAVETAEGQTTEVYMSSSPMFSYNKAGTLVPNYTTRKVTITKAPDPYISVLINNNATADLSTVAGTKDSIATIDVVLSKKYSDTKDLVVKLTPSMVAAGITASPFDYIGLSLINTGDTSGRQLTVTIPAGCTRLSDAGSLLYLYGNRADDNTSGFGKGIKFEAKWNDLDADAKVFFDKGKDTFRSCTATLTPCQPLVLSPEEGAEFTDIPGNVAQEFRIKVSDAVGEMAGKYMVVWDNVNKNPTETNSKHCISNCTVNASGEIVITRTYVSSGTYTSVFYVKNQDGAVSEKRTIKVTVEAPKEIKGVASQKVYAEGETASVSFEFSTKYEGDGSSGFVFLVPRDEASSNAVTCTAFTEGVEVMPGSASTYAPASLFFKDNGSFSYDIVVRNRKQLDAVDGVTYTEWASQVLSIGVTNIVPKVSYVEVSGTPVEGVGTVMSNASVGVTRVFTVTAEEPGDVDRETPATESKALTTLWSFCNGNTVVSNVVVRGNPANVGVPYVFTAQGANKVMVSMWDKDMTDQEIANAKKPANCYWFYVYTERTPAVSVESYTGTLLFSEDAVGIDNARFVIRLTEAASAPLKLRVEMTRNGAGNAVTYPFPTVKGHAGTGFQELSTEWTDALRVYEVPFKAGQLEEYVYLYQADGTLLTESDGFILKVSVVTDTTSTDPTKTWAQYFEACSDFSFRVMNADPRFTGVDPDTNAVLKAVNVAFQIPWSTIDIWADKTNGLTVAWTTSEGVNTNFVTDAANNVFCYEGNYTCTFTEAGKKTVECTITDKDGGSVKRTWYYEVKASKNVLIYPHRPNNNAQSALANKYVGSQGSAAGRVWANGSLSEVKNFVHQWNYAPEASAARIYAHGYRAQSTDDGSLTPAQDIPLDAGGVWHKDGVYGNHYAYAYDYDSFFYTWIKVTGDSESGKEGVHLSEPQPEQLASDNAEASVDLPEYEEDTVSYAQMLFEAIFSREYRKTDNLGDINSDRVPDVYAVRSWTTGANQPIFEAAGYGAFADAGDLKSVETYNGDEDYLPAKTSTGKTLIPTIRSNWATVGATFDAYFEIRGYGLGLNHRADNDDESKNIFVKGTWISDPDYTLAEAHAFCKWYNKNEKAEADPDLEPPADEEALAQWHTDNDAVIRASSWSPENRTDPTTDDTDGDGFPDGYEYYFWYQAHVGTMIDGKLVKMEGEKFQLANIAKGTLITSEEIEAAFNPTLSAGTDARQSRDTDGDGLTDYEELLMGTNPVHWDTDGDGMSDLWECMFGLDPLVAMNDLDKNLDGDFMAQATTKPEYAIVTLKNGESYAVEANGAGFLNDDGDKLADDLTAIKAIPVYHYGNDSSAWVSRKRGKRVANKTLSTFGRIGKKAVLAEPGTREYHTVWEFAAGSLPLDPDEIAVTDDDIKEATVKQNVSIQLVHDQVYAQYGFDPRTGWCNANNYVGARWNTLENPAAVNAGKAGSAINTVAFTAHDEYLVLKYRYETAKYTGSLAATPFWNWIEEDLAFAKYTIDADTAWMKSKEAFSSGENTALAAVLFRGTTNPNVAFSGKTYGDAEPVFASDVHGADTDGDGVPDGWELYVGFNPNSDKDAAGKLAVGGEMFYDEDGLSLRYEFAGTDTAIAYAGCETVAKYGPASEDSDFKGWFNKFFPTDPWDSDTDGDGIADSQEGAVWKDVFRYCNAGKTGDDGEVLHTYTFIYGSPSDDGSLCIRGGGMNPCSIDTDGDLIPDPFEMQYAGVVFQGGTPQDISLSMSMIESINRLDGIGAAAVTNANVGATNNYAKSGAYITAGMDATFGPDPENAMVVGDAFTTAGSLINDPRTGTHRDFDFDQDGLQNFQEYLVQALRHLRYDDTETPLMGSFLKDGVGARKFVGFLPMQTWDGASFFDAAKAAGFTGLANFSEKFGKLGYFARPPHAWDKAACDTEGLQNCANYEEPGYRYMLLPQGLTTMATSDLEDRIMAKGYAATDPREWDTDGDGMDDFYELFHGLNPLLGDTMTLEGTRDIISDVYGWKADADFSAYYNAWNGWDKMFALDPDGHYDAMKYPWLMGLAMCDADGDGLRNSDEMLLVNTANPMNYHTDPTPLWMTDSSTLAAWAAGKRRPCSFTAQYYGLNVYDSHLNTATPDLAYYPWWTGASDEGSELNFFFAFEENEGYDTDHDGFNDMEEVTRTVLGASDPLLNMDPDRRQALYFTPGENGAVKSAAISYSSSFNRSSIEDAFYFRQFTVECWIRPEKVLAGHEQVILERACVYGGSTLSNNTAQIRANFRIGIAADGRLFGLFDNNNAVESGSDFTSATVYGIVPPENAWTHVALSYDGSILTLYVNGAAGPSFKTTLIPANGIVSVSQRVLPGTADYAMSGYTSLPSGMILGARFATADGFTLNADADWSNYASPFAGWLDEVRVWDGARSAGDINTDYVKRYSFADVAANRDTVYRSWAGKDSSTDLGTPPCASRNNNDGKLQLPAELVVHYNFANLASEVDPMTTQWEPSGFSTKVVDNLRVEGKPIPGDIYCGWWFDTPIHSTVYSNYRLVPWIYNTTAHLPTYDGSTVDSQYWSLPLAGVTFSNEVGVSAFNFPNSANPYSLWNNHFEATYRASRLVQLFNYVDKQKPALSDMARETQWRYTFDLRRQFVGVADLVPCGEAFAKRCPDYWDGDGATDADVASDWDGNENALPDWWEALYAGLNGNPAELKADDIIWWQYEVNGKVRGVWITAREAYLRDLSLGMLPSATAWNDLDAVYRSTSDKDEDGLPDWWEDAYDIFAENAEDDSDGDGLSNYAEYLLGECFCNYGFPRVEPNVARTFENADTENRFSLKNQKVPDYFLKTGKLYLGEMFADHDWVEDKWEDQYATPINRADETLYASRYTFDAWADFDNDGWCNWSECRMDTEPTKANTTGIDGYSVAEHPVPDIQATVSLVGEGTLDAPIYVMAFSEKREINRMPDAIWGIGMADEVTRYMGFNPNRAISLTLGGGSVEPGSVSLAVKCTRWLNSSSTGGTTIQFIDTCPWTTMVHDEPHGDDPTKGNLFSYGNNQYVVGSIDYNTGYVTIDYSRLQDPYMVKSSDTDSQTFFPDNGFFTISWKTVVAPGSRTTTITLNTPVAAAISSSEGVQANEGSVREGMNTFVAFLDRNGDGVWTPGEPYGVVTHVDVGYNSASFKVELTDVAPQTMRINLLSAIQANEFTAQQTLNDRGIKNSMSVGSNRAIGSDALAKSVPMSEETETRVRLVRTALNNISSYKKSTTTYYASGAALDTTLDLTVNPFLTEYQVLRNGQLDLDWGNVASLGNTLGISSVTSVMYRVVLGDGTIDPYDSALTNANNLATMFINRFEYRAAGSQTACVPLSPGGTIYSAQPTFRWTHKNSINKDYPAFQLRVWKGSTLVYDSGAQRAPARDADGVYSWAAPIYVDMPTPNGFLFANTNNYTWSVSMLDAKFTTPNTTETKMAFRVEATGLLGNLSDYGTITADIRYFGPVAVSATAQKGMIHVQAFTSPDFSGVPAGEARVSALKALDDYASPTGSVVVIRGVPAGTYYLRAFIDSDGDYKCSPWESWGYACYVGDPSAPFVKILRGTQVGQTSEVTASAFQFTPKAYVVAKNAVVPHATIYIEDMDTDNDGLPDAWESTTGDLDAKSSPQGNTFFTKVNTNLATSVSAYVNLGRSAAVQNKSYAVMTLMSNLVRNEPEAVIAARRLLAGGDAAEMAVEELSLSISAFSLNEGLELAVSTEVSGSDDELIITADQAQVGVYLVAATSADFSDAVRVKVKSLTIKANDTTTLAVTADELKAAIEANGLTASGFFKVALEAE